MSQWASTRPDLYPPALIRRLEKLQDDVRVPHGHSMATVESTLRGAFGPDWKEYLELEPTPLGACRAPFATAWQRLSVLLLTCPRVYPRACAYACAGAGCVAQVSRALSISYLDLYIS